MLVSVLNGLSEEYSIFVTLGACGLVRDSYLEVSNRTYEI